MSAPNFRLGWQALNRVYIGQISSLDTEKGVASVVIFDGLDTTRLNLELPMGGFSMNGLQSSWVRYMPQLRSKPTSDSDLPGGDLVCVAFGPRGEARIVGYATIPGMYEGFAKAKATNPKLVPRGDFTNLQQGEWDLRSSGGAYIFGSRDGMLLMSAGPTVQARFDKPNNEARCEAGLWKIGGIGSFLKIGDVKRLLPSTYKETDVSSLDATTPKEFYVHLETPVPGGAALPIADYELGAVRSSVGAPVTGSVGSSGFLRERKRIYAVDGLNTVFTSELDALGNHHVQYGAVSTQVQVDGGLTTNLEANFVSVEVNASKDAKVLANESVTLDAVAIKLGAAAVSPAVHGTQASTVLNGIVDALIVLANTQAPLELTQPKSAAWTAFAAAMTLLKVGVLAQPNGPSGLLSAKVTVE